MVDIQTSLASDYALKSDICACHCQHEILEPARYTAPGCGPLGNLSGFPFRVDSTGNGDLIDLSARRRPGAVCDGSSTLLL